MYGNLHLDKTEAPVSSVLAFGAEKHPFQDELPNAKVGLKNLVSDQIHIQNVIHGALGDTNLSTDLLPNVMSKPSVAYKICDKPQAQSDGCGVEPNKPLIHGNPNEPLLITADNEQDQCSTLEPDKGSGGESSANAETPIYFCLTCSRGNISVEGLSKHPQCIVMVEKNMLEATDHSYTKKKQRVMNYLLTHGTTSIHIKCFMSSANQPERFLCSLCCSDKQMLVSEACEHVRLLSGSVLLCGLQENGPLFNSRSLPTKQVSNSEHSLSRKKISYMCVVCGKLYTKQTSLGIHMKSHTGEPSPCSHCSKVFMSQAMLNAHLNVHGVFPYKCSQCSKAFVLEPLLNQHVATDHTSTLLRKPRKRSRKKICIAPFKCKNCVGSFKSESELNIHLKTHNYLCSVCGKNFLTLCALKSHDKSHVKSPSTKNVKSHIVCEICGVIVFSMKSLNKHVIRQHGKNVNKSFVCETCGAAFWEKHDLGMHQTIHSEERPFSCDLCPATFKRRNYLSSHVESMHSSHLDPCVTCGMKFYTKKDKAEHLKTHLSTLHTCNICNKNLTSKTGLYLHHKYTHERNNNSRPKNVVLKSVLQKAKQGRPKARLNIGDEPPFSCSLCEKSYNSKPGLYQHRRKVHFRVNKEHPCKICGKVYTNVFSLYAHKNVHVKKEFICDICDKVFLWQSSFRQHLATHSSVKKHHCEYCDKSFHRKFLLDTHTRTHTGEKPYACEICGNAFAQLSDMNRHRARHVQSSDCSV